MIQEVVALSERSPVLAPLRKCLLTPAVHLDRHRVLRLLLLLLPRSRFGRSPWDHGLQRNKERWLVSGQQQCVRSHLGVQRMGIDGGDPLRLPPDAAFLDGTLPQCYGCCDLQHCARDVLVPHVSSAHVLHAGCPDRAIVGDLRMGVSLRLVLVRALVERG